MLDAFLDSELGRTGLDESKLALVGFSQGTMMALHVGLRRKRAPAAILGYSGMLVGPEHLGEATARSATGRTPPILLVHGDQDNVLPIDAFFAATDDLGHAEIPVQWHLSFGVAHWHRCRRFATWRAVPSPKFRSSDADMTEPGRLR